MVKYELKNPLAPATKNQLWLLSKLTTQDWPRLESNPDGLTMAQAQVLITQAMETRKAWKWWVANKTAGKVLFSKADIVAGLMANQPKTIPSEMTVAMTAEKLKAQGYRVEIL